ncbi:secreted lipase like protein [Verticillium longisporum]|nr:secreted lipase like protein [Verticillium longisporum]
MGDSVLNALYSFQPPVHQQRHLTIRQRSRQPAPRSSARSAGPVVLVGHSPRAASCPLLITDARPELTKALVLELMAPPPPFRDAIFSTRANRADKPTLVVTAEASYHMPYDYCTVDFHRRAGCSGTRHVELADEGIRGNGYRFFVAKNSDVIQRLPEKWISAQ